MMEKENTFKFIVTEEAKKSANQAEVKTEKDQCCKLALEQKAKGLISSKNGESCNFVVVLGC